MYFYYNELFFLTDNTVSVHDINAINFNLVYSIPKSKGPATLFTLDIKVRIQKILKFIEIKAEHLFEILSFSRLGVEI